MSQEEPADVAEKLKNQEAVVTDCYVSGFEGGVNRFYTNINFAINPYSVQEGVVSAEAVNSDKRVEESTKEEWQNAKTCGQELGELLAKANGKEIQADGDFLLLQISYYDEQDYHYLQLYLAAGEEDLPEQMQENLQRYMENKRS